LYRFIRFFSQKLCICIALNDTFLSIAAQHCRCVECRAGTSIFCHFVDVGGGTVWIFYFPWLHFGVYGTIEQVGVAGQYGFLVSLALFWGVQYDGNGGAVVLCITFHFSQFAVSSLGGWICAVGILRFYPLWYL
jgi:hypothetical protein